MKSFLSDSLKMENLNIYHCLLLHCITRKAHFGSVFLSSQESDLLVSPDLCLCSVL